jgi:hypothetical protein
MEASTQGCIIAQFCRFEKSICLSLTPRGKDSLLSSFSYGTMLRFGGLGNESKSIFRHRQQSLMFLESASQQGDRVIAGHLKAPCV